MVGKVWSEAEEKYFWRNVVERSAKRTGINRANPELSWDQLATEMNIAMVRQGTKRRDYTATGLFEHYFQNIEGQRTSPNAVLYVNEYLEKLGPEYSREAKAKGKAKEKAKPKPRRTRQNHPKTIADLPSVSRGVCRRFAASLLTSSTTNGPVASLPSPSATTPAPVKDEAEYLSSSPNARRPATAPRPFRPIVPAPCNGRISKPSPTTGSTCNSASIQWGYQTGKLPNLAPSSNLVPSSSAQYMPAPIQPAASSFPTPPYTSTHCISNQSTYQTQSETPNASEYSLRESRAVNPYHGMGYQMSQQNMPMQPPAYNSYQYQSSYAPRQHNGLEYQSKYSSEQSPSGSTSPDIYSAASILTNFATSRPESTQSYLAQTNGMNPYRGNYQWNQQPGPLPSPHEPYPKTSTAPNSSHFRISPPGQTVPDDTVEEGLFVEDDEGNEQSGTPTDHHRGTNRKSPVDNEAVIDSIEVADAQRDGSTTPRGREEKAPEYSSRDVAQAYANAMDKKRALHEWMDFSSESLDYDDVNDGDYVPGMSLAC